MTVKVIIHRTFFEGYEDEIREMLFKYRRKAMQFKGYITGETLSLIENPNMVNVISCWQNIESWRAWQNSKERQDLENKIKIYQDGPTLCEEYNVGF